MSQCSMVELNHDLCPSAFDDAALLAFGRAMASYMRSGDPRELPDGVTYFWRRHHSDPCPIANPPPHGWDNRDNWPTRARSDER